MTGHAMGTIRNFFLEIVTVLTVAAAIIHIGSVATLGVMIAAFLIVPFVTLAMNRLATAQNEVLEGLGLKSDREWTEASRKQAAWPVALMFPFACLAFTEFYWYMATHRGLENFGGVVVTNPTEWLMANVIAIPAAISGWKRSPEHMKPFMMFASAAIVMMVLLVSSAIPHLLARW